MTDKPILVSIQRVPYLSVMKALGITYDYRLEVSGNLYESIEACRESYPVHDVREELELT